MFPGVQPARPLTEATSPDLNPAPAAAPSSLTLEDNGPESLTSINILEGDDLTGEEQEEKARLIAQVLELQNTLDDLSSRVDNVKEENLRLRSENQVLGQYIENLMAASSVFQPANGDTTSGGGPGARGLGGKKK